MNTKKIVTLAMVAAVSANMLGGVAHANVASKNQAAVAPVASPLVAPPLAQTVSPQVNAQVGNFVAVQTSSKAKMPAERDDFFYSDLVFITVDEGSASFYSARSVKNIGGGKVIAKVFFFDGNEMMTTEDVTIDHTNNQMRINGSSALGKYIVSDYNVDLALTGMNYAKKLAKMI